MKLLRSMRFIFLTVIFSVLSFCNSVSASEETAPVESVILNAHSLELKAGETFQLTAVVSPENAEYEDLFYQVSNSEYDGPAATVAEVDPNTGLITAYGETEKRNVNPVEVSVYVTIGDSGPVKMDSCIVTVIEPTEPWYASVKDFKASPAGMNRVSLSWSPTQGADGYIILKNGVQIAYTTNQGSYMDENANSNAFDFYWIIPYSLTTGKGVLSRYVWAIGRVIDTVTDVEAVSLDGIRLSWTAAEGANEYVVLSKTNTPNASFNEPIRTVDLTVMDDQPEKGHVMFYWVYGLYRNPEGRIIASGGLSSYVWVIR